jgi:hypothetical protein
MPRRLYTGSPVRIEYGDFWTGLEEKIGPVLEKWLDPEVAMAQQAVDADTMRAEASRDEAAAAIKNAELLRQRQRTADYNENRKFWDDRLQNVPVEMRGPVMKAANAESQSKFGQYDFPQLYTAEELSSNIDITSKVDAADDILSRYNSGESVTSDEINKAAKTYTDNIGVDNTMIGRQKSANDLQQIVRNNELAQVSLGIIESLGTDFKLPSNIMTQVQSLKGKRVTPQMVQAVAAGMDTYFKQIAAADKKTLGRMKLSSEALSKWSKQLFDLSGKFTEMGNAEKASEYASLASELAAKAATVGVEPSKKIAKRTGLEFKEREAVLGERETLKSEWANQFDNVADDETVHYRGKDISGSEFNRLKADGKVSNEELTKSYVADRNIPEDVYDANIYKGKPVWDTATGKKHKISKFMKVAEPSAASTYDFKQVSLPFANRIQVIDTGGKVVDENVSISEFNEKYSLVDPKKSFKAQYPQVLSGDEYDKMKADAEKYAIDTLGFTGSETPEEMEALFNKLYKQFPQLAP